MTYVGQNQEGKQQTMCLGELTEKIHQPRLRTGMNQQQTHP